MPPIMNEMCVDGAIMMQSGATYWQTLGTVEGGTLVLDAQTGLIIDVNPVPEKTLEYSKAELLGKGLWDLGQPNDIDAAKQNFRELIENKHVRSENVALLTKDRICVNAEVVSSVHEMNGSRVVLCKIRSTKQQEERDQLLRKIQGANRMEALVQLDVGLVHDTNNLLGVILGYCELLMEQVHLPESAHEIILEMHNVCTSAKDLTQRSLAYSRPQEPRLEVFDLKDAVNRIAFMQDRFGGDIQLRSSFGDGLGMVCADPRQIDQVLLNLAINARDAMPKGGNIVIETSNIEIDESSAHLYPSIKLGRYIMLTFSDTGIGMDQETKSHIFEPFFSTKPVGKGTGIGLFTAQYIVKQMGGAITVDSEPGAGTTFKVFFPRCDSAPSALQPNKAISPHGGTETILLVDDSVTLRRLLRKILAGKGYTVLESGDPVEALRMAADYPGTISLMITDMELPGFNGTVLAGKLAAFRPETKVLYATGSNIGSTVSSSAFGQDYACIVKPFSTYDLLIKVRELLSPATKSPKRSAF